MPFRVIWNGPTEVDIVETPEGVDGIQVFSTFSDAKRDALEGLGQARRKILDQTRSIRALHKSDIVR